MSTYAPSQTEIIHAYRSLLRASLQAVAYSKPARYQIIEIFRQSFRSPPNSTPVPTSTAPLSVPTSTPLRPLTRSSFNTKRIANTLAFLHRARAYAGLEHKILKNILLVRYWRADNEGINTSYAGETDDTNFTPEEVMSRASDSVVREDDGVNSRVFRKRDRLPFWLTTNTNVAYELRKQNNGGNAWAQFDATVAMLNESMELCLRT